MSDEQTRTSSPVTLILVGLLCAAIGAVCGMANAKQVPNIKGHSHSDQVKRLDCDGPGCKTKPEPTLEGHNHPGLAVTGSCDPCGKAFEDTVLRIIKKVTAGPRNKS